MEQIQDSSHHPFSKYVAHLVSIAPVNIPIMPHNIALDIIGLINGSLAGTDTRLVDGLRSGVAEPMNPTAWYFVRFLLKWTPTAIADVQYSARCLR